MSLRQEPKSARRMWPFISSRILSGLMSLKRGGSEDGGRIEEGKGGKRQTERAIPQKNKDDEENGTLFQIKQYLHMAHPKHTSLISYSINYHQITLHNLGKFHCLSLLLKNVYNSDTFVIQLSVICLSPFISSVTTLFFLLVNLNIENSWTRGN